MKNKIITLALIFIFYETFALEDITMIGAHNQALSHRDINDTTITGSHITVIDSSNTVAVGHNSTIRHSENALILGNEAKVTNANRLVAIGDHIHSSGNATNIIIGSYNAPSDAFIVMANGSPQRRSNILEISPTGFIHSAQFDELNEAIITLTNRIAALESQLQANEQQCSCGQIQRWYKRRGCC